MKSGPTALFSRLLLALLFVTPSAASGFESHFGMNHVDLTYASFEPDEDRRFSGSAGRISIGPMGNAYLALVREDLSRAEFGDTGSIDREQTSLRLGVWHDVTDEGHIWL
jgi:hypothetical protein